MNEPLNLIAGMLSSGAVNFWECNFNVNINDAVLVNNRSAYDVVKVVGIVHTTTENAKHFTGGATLKKAISVIDIPKEEASA
jgi:hypothetical protein